MFNTPKFWLRSCGFSALIAMMLVPFSWIYRLGFYLKKNFIKAASVQLPVICVGNLNVGGAGKTPTALAIGHIFHEIGLEFCYLTRGYGGNAKSPQFFEKNQLASIKEAALTAGDEAILLNEIAAICVAKNRLDGANQIVSKNKFKAILLDDGLQNFSLKKDFVILVVDGQIGFGNGKVMPAGPLRQKVRSGLKLADLVIIIGQKNQKLKNEITCQTSALLIEGQIRATNFAQFRNKKILAFCGLAYPSKFFSFLENQGLELVKTVSFADHHKYENKELVELQNQASALSATLLTTKKDWVKFSPILQQEIPYLDIALELENKELVIDSIIKKLTQI